jgi:uncharacterized membrane protein
MFWSGYLTVFLVLAFLDAAWLSFTLNNLYRPALGHLMSERPRMLPAMLFYLVYPLGVTALIVQPSLQGLGLHYALTRGAVLGLTAYATYNLASMASLRGWPAWIGVLDIAWGTVTTCASSIVTVFVLERVG